MCGILCIFGNNISVSASKETLKHRGPDETRVYQTGKCYMEFTRLAINDLSSEGSQPFVDGEKALMCNGEIYNFRDFDTVSKNDCAFLLKMIGDIGIFETSKKLRGDFVIVYTDGKSVKVSRDHIGVRPLFYTLYDGGIAFASEMKGLLHFRTPVGIFPPGHVYNSETDSMTCYAPLYWDFPKVPAEVNLGQIMQESVDLRVGNSDREVAFLLSGGVDSSIVAALGGKNINTFSIGMPGSPDTVAAATMARHIGANHTNVPFDAQMGISVLRDVIKSIESYDTTTVRASVPMWLLSQYISQNTPFKVILSGEGSDELFAGYKYFQNAPSTEDMFSEIRRRVMLLHQFDVLRADRCTAAHGLELRVPFLDKEFVKAVMMMDQSLKLPTGELIEKCVLRSEFQGKVPYNILWRPKDAFSDAVGYSWIDEVKAYAETQVSDEEFEYIKLRSKNHNVPLTKEEALYRRTFWEFFGFKNDMVITEMWRPRWTNVTEPSARYIVKV